MNPTRPMLRPKGRAIREDARLPGSGQALFDSLAAHTPVGVFVSDSHGSCVFVNERWCELAGMSGEQAMGEGWQEALHEDDIERVKLEWAEASASGRDSLVAYRMVRPDGTVSWIEGYASAIQDDHGGVLGWVGSCYDISVRKRAEDDAVAALTLLEAVQNTAPIGFGFIDREFRIVRMNPTLAAVSGGTAAELIGQTVAEALPALWPTLEPFYRSVLETGTPIVGLELSGPSATAADKISHWLSSFYPVTVGGDVTGIGLVVVDISEKKKAELALRQSKDRFEALFEQIVDVIFTTDLAGNLTSANQAAEALLGYTRDQITQLNFFDLIVPDQHERVTEVLTRSLAERTNELVALDLVRNDGHKVSVEVAGRVLVDDVGEPVGFLGVARDLTERHALHEELRYQALHDHLTGLPNRLLLLDRLSQAAARADRPGSKLAILMLDLDNFKHVNDTLGHQVGDDILVELAPRLQGVLCGSDTVARLGGDEFAFVLEEFKNERELIAIARRILAAVEQTPETTPAPRRMTASLGIAVSQPGDTPELLLRNADIAMYRAKDQRGGTYALFDKQMSRRVQRQLDLEDNLSWALDRDQLTVHYQPILSMANNRVLALEALVRWPHPEWGWIQPSEFIPIAEEGGLIIPLGRTVIAQVAHQTGIWRANHPDALPLGTFVNLSPRELSQPDLIQFITDTLVEHQARPSDLGIEITERVFIDTSDAVLNKNLTELTKLGTRLALDDFGTGYSALATLKAFPFDVVKIDRFFIRAIRNATDSAPITAAIIDLAHALNIRVIAEGVETAIQAQYLKDLGCDAAQGFHYGRPQTATRIGQLLHASRPAHEHSGAS